MRDIVRELEAAHREVAGRPTGTGDSATAVVLRRRYDAETADVWDACTDPDRLRRWFLPVSGDLRVGGRYQLEGNAGGEILRCEPPRLLHVTWVFDGKPSEVRMELSSDGDGTRFELSHTAVPDPEFWARYGPGATGVGWDLTLLGLAAHLDGEKIEEADLAATPEGREFVSGSGRAWGAAHRAAGAPAEDADAAAANTIAFYTGG